MEKGGCILVTGANSLLGQHVIKHLHLYVPNVERIKTWDTLGPYENRIEYGSDKEIRSNDKFTGLMLEKEMELAKALAGVSTVIHALEIQDYSMSPDVEKMDTINFGESRALIDACERSESVKHFIFVSSIFIHASTVWPSALNPELTKIPPHSEWPFPDYLRSKWAAEQLLRVNGNFNSMIVRMGPLYGEGDESSVFATILRKADNNSKVVSVLGDRQGVIQHTYAGNAAWGIVKVLEKLRSEPKTGNEIVFLLDDTPLVDIYTLLEPLAEARGCTLSKRRIPWFPFYGLYLCLEKVLCGLEGVMGPRLAFLTQNLPSSNFFYTHFYFWYFYSGTKAQTYLGCSPLYSHPQAVDASARYYADCKL